MWDYSGIISNHVVMAAPSSVRCVKGAEQILTFLVRNSVIYGHSEVDSPGLYMCFICCITRENWKTCLNENGLQLHYIPLDGVFVTICAWRGNCLLTDLVDVWIEYIATSKAVLRCNHHSKHIWVELKMSWKLFQCVVNWAEEKVFCHSFQIMMGGTMNGNVPQRLQDDNYVDKSTCVPDSQAHQIQPPF